MNLEKVHQATLDIERIIFACRLELNDLVFSGKKAEALKYAGACESDFETAGKLLSVITEYVYKQGIRDYKCFEDFGRIQKMFEDELKHIKDVKSHISSDKGAVA